MWSCHPEQQQGWSRQVAWQCLTSLQQKPSLGTCVCKGACSWSWTANCKYVKVQSMFQFSASGWIKWNSWTMEAVLTFQSFKFHTCSLFWMMLAMVVSLSGIWHMNLVKASMVFNIDHLQPSNLSSSPLKYCATTSRSRSHALLRLATRVTTSMPPASVTFTLTLIRLSHIHTHTHKASQENPTFKNTQSTWWIVSIEIPKPRCHKQSTKVGIRQKASKIPWSHPAPVAPRWNPAEQLMRTSSAGLWKSRSRTCLMLGCLITLVPKSLMWLSGWLVNSKCCLSQSADCRICGASPHSLIWSLLKARSSQWLLLDSSGREFKLTKGMQTLTESTSHWLTLSQRTQASTANYVFGFLSWAELETAVVLASPTRRRLACEPIPQIKLKIGDKTGAKNPQTQESIKHKETKSRATLFRRPFADHTIITTFRGHKAHIFPVDVTIQVSNVCCDNFLWPQDTKLKSNFKSLSSKVIMQSSVKVSWNIKARRNLDQATLLAPQIH